MGKSFYRGSHFDLDLMMIMTTTVPRWLMALLGIMSLLVNVFEATLFIQDTPFFAAPIQNTSVGVGSTARLACVVENLGPFQVAWVHKESGAVLSVGVRVLTSNSRVTVIREQRSTWVLVISNVTQNDAGEYMCQVSTSPPRKLYGFLSVVDSICLYESPVFEWHSQIPRVNEGKTAILECHVTGIPKPTILWKREDNEDIRINSSISMPSFHGNILTLEDASASSAGAYICIASNGHPPSASRVLLLRVNHVPLVQFVFSTPKFWVKKGDLATLSCRYAAFPHPRIVFHRQNFYGNRNFTVSDLEVKRILHQFPFTHSVTLTLPIIEDRDFGNYSCVVRNEVGEAYDSLILKEIPNTTTSPLTISVRNLTTATTTTTTSQTEIERRAPVPLRDGSFAISTSEASKIVTKTTTTDDLTKESLNSKRTDSNEENGWSRKIARINISRNSRSNGERPTIGMELLSILTIKSFIIGLLTWNV